MPNKKKERKVKAKRAVAKNALAVAKNALDLVQMKLDRLLLPVEQQIDTAIREDNVQLVGNLLAPPRLGIGVVTDAFIHNRILSYPTSSGTFNPQVYRWLCRSMSETLIQDIKSDSCKCPLLTSIWHGHVQAMKFLVNNFGEIFSIHESYENGWPLFHFVVSTCRNLSLEVKREICHFLVHEKGADPNQRNNSGGTAWIRVIAANDTEGALLLLEFEADPNLCDGGGINPIDYAIMAGNQAIVSSLLLHGAILHGLGFVVHLLRNEQKTHNTKLEICRALLNQCHVAGNNNTLRIWLEYVIDDQDDETCTILFDMLFEVGITPTLVMNHAINLGNESICQRLVSKPYQVDPFVMQEDEYGDVSPFLFAARQNKIAILDNFLDLWDVQFEPSRYRNGNGDKPEDLLLRDPHASLQAFTHVAERYYEEDIVTRMTKDFVKAHMVGSSGIDESSSFLIPMSGLFLVVSFLLFTFVVGMSSWQK